MAASSFDAALAFVWRPENDGQPYHTDPNDSGGATSYGVTHATWDDAVAEGIVSGDLEFASKTALSRILRIKYWNAVRGDDVPAGADLAVFNFAMVAGPGRAARTLQQVVGAQQDGAIGPLTMAAVRRMDPDKLIEAFTADEEAFYAMLADAKYFLRGWDRRAEDCRVASRAIADAHAAPQKIS